MPGNVVPLHRCICGEPGTLRSLVYEGEEIDYFACDACVAQCDEVLARVRPVFEALIAAGVSHETANETMTFCLDRMAEDDGRY